MKIPRDLYYILNRQEFTDAPWCRSCSVEEVLERLGEEGLSFDLWPPLSVPFEHPDAFEPAGEKLAPYCFRESVMAFHKPASTGCASAYWSPLESIEFEPYALHNGDEQPLRVKEARERFKEGEDLELMHVPVRYLSIPLGENLHTLTERDFESVVGQVEKPVGLTWRFQTPRGLFKPPMTRPTSDAVKKVEFLQECMVGLRIVDPGSKSKEEAVQVFSQILNCRWFYAADNFEDFYWLNWEPAAYLGLSNMRGPRKDTTTTFMEIPPDFANTTEDDHPTYKKAQLRAMAAHEGNREPIPVAKAKAMANEDTELMQVPLGYIGWVPTEKRQGIFEQPVSWTWTEDWEEPSEWIWADGWEEPIELTWRNASGREGELGKSTVQKIAFLRHYLKMIYIVDTGKGIEEGEVARAIEDLAKIELRHSTDSLGQDYWWKVQHDGSSTKTSSRSSVPYNPTSRPGKDRSDPRVPSQTVVDLYGGDEEQAHTHWWNTH